MSFFFTFSRTLGATQNPRIGGRILFGWHAIVVDCLHIQYILFYRLMDTVILLVFGHGHKIVELLYGALAA